MTPDEIRQLSGRELDLAVYEMLHGKEAAAIARKYGAGVAWVHKSLDAAWKLDGNNWRWVFSQAKLALHVTVFVGEIGNILAGLAVLFSDFPTKAEAYATARARVWLLAMGR